jgi:uncharacterized protein YggE
MSSFSSPLSGKIVGLSLVIAVLAVAFLGFVAYAAMTQHPSQAATNSVSTATQTSTPSTITVTGSGTSSGAPDQVLVTLGVTNTGPNASKVLLQNSANMTNILAAIETGLNVNKSDVQTTQFNFSPNYNGCCPGTLTGYTATNMITVTLQGAETSKLDTLLNAAVNAGANQIQNIQYMLSNTMQGQLKQQALVQAVVDANQTALKTAASENKLVLGIQTVVVISGSGYPGPYYYGNSAALSPAAVPAVNYNIPIAPGQTQYSIEVQVTYLLGQ